MASLYPGQIDNNISLPPAIDNQTVISGAFLNNIRSAIINIEVTLGSNPGGTYGVLADRITALENSINDIVVIKLAQDLGGTLSDPLVIGLQGRPVSTQAPTTGQVLIWNGSSWGPGTISGGGGGSIISSLQGPAVFFELGEALVNPIFTAQYNVSPASVTFVDNKGNPALNVLTAPPPSLPPNVFMYPQSYLASNVSNLPFSVIFTLTANAGGANSTSTFTATWGQNVYYGIGSSGQTSASFIKSLTEVISNDKATNFTVNAGAGQAIYYAYPTRLGTADFWIEGFEGGFNLISTTISLTNNFGFTENYTLYQSAQVNLGLTQIYVF